MYCVQGLAYLAQRDAGAHEALVQADLLLKMAAGRALAAMGGAPPHGPAGYTDVDAPTPGAGGICTSRRLLPAYRLG